MTDIDMWRRCVSIASLAPSKHNAQPWWYELVDGGVRLHADGARSMPTSDPHGREVVIGCGAALQHLCLALRGEGWEPAVTRFPAGEGNSVVAEVGTAGRREPTVSELRLLAAVPDRHTNRGPLDGARLGADAPFVLQGAAERQFAKLYLVTSTGSRNAMDDLITRAERSAARDIEMKSELRQWLRPADTSSCDGVPVSAAASGAGGAYRGRFVQRDFDPSGQAVAGRDMGDDDPMLAVLWTDGDSPVDWLRAGMALGEVLLALTAGGGSASLLNQPIEIPPLRAAVRTELGITGFPQLILRLGVGHPVTATPRRHLDDLLVPH
jgi:hypothetical protein